MSETTRPIYKLFGRTKALFSSPYLHQKTSHVPTKTHVLSASRKETRPTQQKMDLFKMYLLLKMGDFNCHILLVGRKEPLRKHHACWDFFWDESWWIHGHPTKNSKNNMICRCHSYSKSHANFKQFCPNVSLGQLQTPNTKSHMILRPHEDVVLTEIPQTFPLDHLFTLSSNNTVR